MGVGGQGLGSDSAQRRGRTREEALWEKLSLPAALELYRLWNQNLGFNPSSTSH